MHDRDVHQPGDVPVASPRRLIALTGATGFIGRHLLQSLGERGYRLRILLRRPGEVPEGAASAVVGDLERPRNMAAALADVDTIVHSAGIAHAMSGRPDDDYRALNTEATVALAQAAQRAGVRRFVFLSSVRAQTGPTAEGVVTEDRQAAPTDAYGRSKLAAEEGLATLDLDWVALRPVLVFGPGVKGNMADLLQLAATRLPLPLGSIAAKRSLVSLDSLAAAVTTAIEAPAPLCRAYLVADDEPMTIGEIVAALRAGQGRTPGLVPVPAALLRLAMAAAGRGEQFERLASPLVVDCAALKALGWLPAGSSRTALAALARG